MKLAYRENACFMMKRSTLAEIRKLNDSDDNCLWQQAFQMKQGGTLAVVVAVGNIADALGSSNRIDVKIEHADDNGSGAPGGYAACTDEDVLNYTGLSSGLFLSIDTADEESKRHVIGYRGGKRFVKVTATPVSLSTGGPIAMIALKGNASYKPVSNS